MFDKLGTDQSIKNKVALPNVGVHAMASGIWSHDIRAVEMETENFIEKVIFK